MVAAFPLPSDLLTIESAGIELVYKGAKSSARQGKGDSPVMGGVSSSLARAFGGGVGFWVLILLLAAGEPSGGIRECHGCPPPLKPHGMAPG